MAPEDPAERILGYLDREGATAAARVAEDLGMSWGELAEHALALDDAGRLTALHVPGEGVMLDRGGRVDRSQTGSTPRQAAGRGRLDAGDVEPEEDLAGMRETVHELTSRVESMQQTLDIHQQRMDRVNASQAVFEREIAELMQDYRGVIADLRGQHRATQRRMDMLFEALEEGLTETDSTVRDAIRDVRDQMEVYHDGEQDVLQDEMDVLQDKVERLEERKANAERIHAAVDEEIADQLGEGGLRNLSLLAETVQNTRERLIRLEQALEERLRDIEGGLPTVVE